MNKLCGNLIVAIAMVALGAGCTGGVASEPTAQAVVHRHALGKPSAQVELTDPGPVTLVPGETRAVTLGLNAAYGQGEMHVEVSGVGPLEVIGGTQAFVFDLAEADPYALPLELYTAEPGRHYLHIIIQLDSPDAQLHAKALAAIIDAGEAPLPRLEPPSSAGNRNNIHSLPAREQVEPR